MKRRGFFGAFAGLMAAPVAAVALKQAEIYDLPVVVPPAEPLTLLPPDMSKYLSYTARVTAFASVDTQINDEYERDNAIIHCPACDGREFVGYANCRHCGGKMPECA